MMDDAELLRRYADERSEAAFTELVRRHLDLVYGAAFRRTDGDAFLAEDIAQQVYSMLAQNARSLRQHPLLAGWLYTATRHATSTVLRTERRRKAREREAFIMETRLSSPENSADWSRLRPELDSVIDQLNERERDAVLLRFFEGRPFAEIGVALRVSEDAARMRVDRALEKLREILVRRGLESTSAALALVLANQAAVAAPAGMAATVTGGALAAAGAATSAGPVLTFLSVMNTSKIIVGAFGLLVASALGVAVHEVYARQNAEAVLATAQESNGALRARLNGLRERSAAEQAAVALKAEPVATTRAASSSASPVRARTGTADALMTRHPEIRRLAIEQRRAEAAGIYLPLFRELNLSSAQREQFLDLILQGTEGILSAADGRGLSFRIDGDQKEATERLQTLLGQEGFRHYKEFGQQTAAWRLTTHLAGSLFDTSAPLTPAQGKQMVRILTENRLKDSDRSNPHYDWSALMPQAEQILSPPQLDALQFHRASDEFEQEVQRQGRASRAAAPPKGDPQSAK